jgi:hypothetical protein
MKFRFKKKKKMKFFWIVITTLIVGYGVYCLYDYAVKDAIRRIKAEVSKSVKRSMLSAINPLSWPGKLFKRGDGDNDVEEKPAE